MGFFLKRIAQMVSVIIAATFLAFAAMNYLGDPLFNVVGFVASVDCDAVSAGEIEDVSGQGGTDVGDCEVVEAAREKYHLNDPLPVRYVRWVGDVVQGDLGVSFKNSMPVTTIIGNRIPKSIFLMVVAEIFALVIDAVVQAWKDVAVNVQESYTYVMLTHTLWNATYDPKVRGACDFTFPDGTEPYCRGTGGGYGSYSTMWFEE